MNANSTGGGGTARITLCDAKGRRSPPGGCATSTRPNGTAPSSTAMTAGIAMEKLELVHEGFL